MFRGGRVSGRRLAWSSVLYLIFAGLLMIH